MPAITRRRVLAMFAAVPGIARAGPRPETLYRWAGTALGADASITLAATDRAHAEALVADAVSEIDRLEDQFSLFRPESALSRLNTAGRLDPADPDFVQLLELCRKMHDATSGMFDPAIQARWLQLARGDRGPQPASHHSFADVEFDRASTRFRRKGMALTFNGIAQGYVTDRVAALFRAQGLTDILVDLGEYRALGRHPDRRPWKIALAGGNPEDMVDLGGAALATSAPFGTTLDSGGSIPQMIDPGTGEPAAAWRQVSVLGPKAAVADAFSTAFSMMAPDAIRRTLSAWPDYAAILFDREGVRTDISA